MHQSVIANFAIMSQSVNTFFQKWVTTLLYHYRECDRGCASSVTRDADRGSRGAESSSGNADSGISGNGGLTLVFYRVNGNI